MSDAPVDIVDRVKAAETTPVYASKFEAQLDRCDRCGAQAKGKFTKDVLELRLCQHHSDQHQDKLGAAGFTAETL